MFPSPFDDVFMDWCFSCVVLVCALSHGNWPVNLIIALQMIWVSTLIFVLVLGVDLGLLAGVVFSLFTVIIRTQLANYETLGSVGGTDVYRNCNTFQTVSFLLKKNCCFHYCSLSK